VTLRTGDVTDPGRRESRVPAFRCAEDALRHLLDHVVTHPECCAWALVLPQYDALLDWRDADARWRFAAEALATSGDSAQALYDLYREAVDSDAQGAGRLRWFVRRGSVTVALGTRGILLVVERDVLVTAFLPGQGDPRRVVRTQRQGADGQSAPVLPREGRGRWRGNPGWEHPRESRRRLEVEERWTPAERLYYRVFRPAVQFVRATSYDTSGMLGRPLRDYGLLRRCLPRMSRLRLQDWLACRRAAGLSGTEEMLP
jgi:hypothetical protein